MRHSEKLTAKNAVIFKKALKIKTLLDVGVVNPITTASLEAALTAAEREIIRPVLIGPVATMHKVAKELHKDITQYEAIDTHDPIAAAEQAAQLAKVGKVAAIMKGDIHSDELMRVVLARENGLRTKRRLSHCLLMDIPTYDKPMIFSDAAINVSPDLNTKRDMVQNAIDFAHSLGISEPLVALLAATETVHDYMPSTTDAAILCKMAERGQISGALLDGPLSIDLSMDEEAIKIKRFKRILKDKPDVFIAPDLDSCNIAIKVLDYMGNGQSAGIVLGAKVPVILMRRSSPAVEQLLSCALAKMYCNHYQNQK